MHKDIKKQFSQSRDIVPTPPGPSPPYQCWDAYQKIRKRNITLLYDPIRSEMLFLGAKTPLEIASIIDIYID